MKKVFLFLVMIVFLGSGTCFGTVGTMGTGGHLPWYKPGKHKLVKRMKPNQVRKAAHGKNFYVRKHGRMVKR